MPISLITPKEASFQIAVNLRRHRIAQQLTQADLADKSGVPLPTLRRFERTGAISLEALLKITHCLSLTEPLLNVLKFEHIASSIDEIIRSQAKPRLRVRKKAS